MYNNLSFIWFGTIVLNLSFILHYFLSRKIDRKFEPSIFEIVPLFLYIYILKGLRLSGMGDIVVIPDVHGRSFWKEAVEKYPDAEKIFLGDYLDPYPDEGISKEKALENFKEILAYSKMHPECQLLLGNHDLHYFMDLDGCRKDWINAPEIRNLFLDNIKLFSLTTLRDIDGEKFLFSHAPITLEWIREVGETSDPELLVNRLNGYLQNLQENRDVLEEILNHISSYRGGWQEWGSPVWCDLYEILEKGASFLPGIDVNIFGHTQIRRPLVTNDFACLDIHRAFIISSDGEISLI